MNEMRPIRAKSGTNQEGTSAHNRRVMIDALRLNGQLSRADLARATALTKQTVSNIIEELECDGLVTSLAAVRKGRGQPSTPYRLVPEGAFAIGLQIDRHVTRTIAVDLIGTVLARGEANLPAGGPATGVATILDLIARTRRDLTGIAPQSRDRFVGLGVAMPGPFGIEADADDPWMMAAWQKFPLLETLSVGTGLDVRLQNDAAAAATAEKMVGAAHGVDQAICIYLGYGLGAGLILNGELYRGANGNAGEIGMILSQPRAVYGIQRAPLEHRASIASLSKILGLDPANPDLYRRIDEIAGGPDARVTAWVEDVAFELQAAIQALESIFDPQTIILCGGMPPGLARLLIEAIHPLLPSIAEHRARSMPRLQLGFTDPWAVAIGAAAEPISRTFDPRFSAILKTRIAGAV
ncbi:MULTISPECIES: ROK family transcriptional regulator [unclassified Sinorhizobium]|uniref:ROK family transcriptional regulator n=1 Tax=unclassified Sinorhizobium TaxID=2613772 RepID=UPI0024C20EB9|nr:MULTISPECIES: ROK family transcriptional regulator [unclassified Sinorhizobium]MDK1377959.1 ROK family transcriptional regulator [Sinorhizobium sp. 6-70]MDK1482283.1 ROK family transcriptional regulator [Sinorhizobium sp. 6-117]